MIDLTRYIFDRWRARFHSEIPAGMTDHREIFRFSINHMIRENNLRTRRGC